MLPSKKNSDTASPIACSCGCPCAKLAMKRAGEAENPKKSASKCHQQVGDCRPYSSGDCLPPCHSHEHRRSVYCCCHCKRKHCNAHRGGTWGLPEKRESWKSLDSSPLRSPTPNSSGIIGKHESDKSLSEKRKNSSDHHVCASTSKHSCSSLCEQLSRMHVTPEASFLSLADISSQNVSAVLDRLNAGNAEGAQAAPSLMERFFDALPTSSEEGSKTSLLPPSEKSSKDRFIEIKMSPSCESKASDASKASNASNTSKTSNASNTSKTCNASDAFNASNASKTCNASNASTASSAPGRQPMDPPGVWKPHGIFETYEQEVIFRNFGVFVEPHERIIVNPPADRQKLVHYEVPELGEPTEQERSTFSDVWLQYRATYPKSFAADFPDTPEVRRTLDKMGQLTNNYYPRKMLQDAFWRALGEWDDSASGGQWSPSDYDRIYRLGDSYYYDVKQQNLVCYRLNHQLYTMFRGFIYYRIAMESSRSNPPLQRRLHAMTAEELKMLSAVDGSCARLVEVFVSVLTKCRPAAVLPDPIVLKP